MNNEQVPTSAALYMPRMNAKLIKIIIRAFAFSWDLLYNAEKIKSGFQF